MACTVKKSGRIWRKTLQLTVMNKILIFLILTFSKYLALYKLSRLPLALKVNH